MNLPCSRFVRLSVAGLSAALAVSCAASRSRTRSSQERIAARQQSVAEHIATTEEQARTEWAYREERIETQEHVPEERVRMTIALATLDSLPEGGRYAARAGRTEVTAVRRGDRLVIEARSDSLRRQTTLAKRVAVRRRDTSEVRTSDCRISTTDSLGNESSTERTSVRSRPAGRWWLIAGFVLCAALFIQRKRRS